MLSTILVCSTNSNAQLFSKKKKQLTTQQTDEINALLFDSASNYSILKELGDNACETFDSLSNAKLKGADFDALKSVEEVIDSKAGAYNIMLQLSNSFKKTIFLILKITK